MSIELVVISLAILAALIWIAIKFGKGKAEKKQSAANAKISREQAEAMAQRPKDKDATVERIRDRGL